MALLGDDQIAFLRFLSDGPKAVSEIKGIINGQRRATLVRRGYAEWVRSNGNPCARAIGIQITEHGRQLLAQ